ncbi:lysophospholipid acyltransferase family protein [Dyadobacter fermentans]|uniref:Lipid A biosynthesis acyltransferase n=1 Tax=Dyadobacter fermentans (strain ATCC 700827 / DSM 18053 / CIP 107007 / KCTC 52180 / NS114) TaxID=471854 RepID=C6W5L6_DYAFD|nr:lysophospholipid acyltransferase family protein [Dyadobacter fermentans]ACT94234.1 lipid A biosynthesis acyltransferase [Dyadobacter fermentans DSM 18053]
MKSRFSSNGRSLASFAIQLTSRVTDWVLLWGFKSLSVIIYFVLRYVLRYRRALIHQNLTNSLVGKPETEIDKLVEAYYRHIGDLVVEPFLFRLAPARLRKRLASYTDLGVLERSLNNDKQVIVFASHYGNWEYLVNLPEVIEYPVYTAYSPIKIEWVNRLMINIRSVFGVNLIAKQAFYRQAMMLLRKQSLPKLLVVIGDQRPAPGSQKFHLPFLDQKTAVQTGGERIAALSEATLVYVHSQKKAQFSYEFTFTEMKNVDRHTPMDVTSAYYHILEQSIFRSPAYWLWSHNRWKVAAAPN